MRIQRNASYFSIAFPYAVVILLFHPYQLLLLYYNAGAAVSGTFTITLETIIIIGTCREHRHGAHYRACHP